MILRFSPRDSYSMMVRLLSNRNNILATARTVSSKAQIGSSDKISAEITKLYSGSMSAIREPTKQLSPAELSKIRAAQRHQNFRLNRRRMYEKISLYSYLNVCVDVGQINRAFNTLVKMSNPRKNSVADINHYNVVIKGWAKLSSIAQVVETRMHMIKNKIEPNAESFAYILLAYVKEHETRLATVRRLYQDMKSKGINPRELFQHTYLNADERDSIVSLLRKIEPSFEDVFCKVPIEYNCKLLKDFDKSEKVAYDFSGLKDLSRLTSWAEGQRSLESRSSIPIESIARIKENSVHLDRYARLWDKYSDIWRKNLATAIDESLETLQAQSEDADKIHLYPYLCSVNKNLLIKMMLDEVETNSTFSTYSISTNSLHLDFGHKVMIRYLRSRSQNDGSYKERQQIYDQYLKEYCTNDKLMSELNPRQYIQVKAAETKNYSIYKDRISIVEEWPHHVVSAVGRFLYGLILREIKFDPETVRNPKREINMKNLVQAFYTAYFQIDCTHKIKEEFRAHQDFDRLHQKASAVKLRFDYSFLPSSSPPMPWLSQCVGGYLTNKCDLVRVNNPFAERSYVSQQKCDNQKLYPSLDSLNALSICPWIVNKEILDLVIGLFQAGGDTELGVPLDESKMGSKEPVLKENASKADRILFNREKKRHDQKKREMYSLWRDCLYRLSIANHFRDRIIWFPHNMDFRGRTYPVPPHFNHLGADLARSLLLFAKGRPLGENGLDWLKLHVINLVGNMKKAPLSERLEYANSILHLEILDSANNPWDGRRWWTKNENPWQVLACCKEIAKAVRSRDARQYISHFPVHQDGSCNGLQHYAALGRDPAGAMAVNLVPCETPQDVYSRVVEIVETMRERDANNGVKMAQVLEGFIQRKVIKQTVMTTVYGVTRYGARQQIARQLIAKGYSEREVWQAAQYLTAKTFDSIGQMFNKSRLIQDWLNECAFIIASKCRQPVSWETPLGFPVQQPYTLPLTSSANRLLSSSISLDRAPVSNDPLSRLNAPKQKTAFPPNYIHSLDSSHMMLTSLYCQRQGITFVSVHDCYWTHPSTVDLMNRICREQFVALHSEPLLKDLSEQFIRKFGSGQTTRLSDLASGDFAIQLVKDKPPAPLSASAASERTARKSKFCEIDEGKLDDEDDDDDEVATAAKRGISEPNLSPGAKSSKPLIDVYESSRKVMQERARARFRDLPTTGDLDLNVIKKSTYFFS